MTSMSISGSLKRPTGPELLQEYQAALRAFDEKGYHAGDSMPASEGAQIDQVTITGCRGLRHGYATRDFSFGKSSGEHVLNDNITVTGIGHGLLGAYKEAVIWYRKTGDTLEKEICVGGMSGTKSKTYIVNCNTQEVTEKPSK